MTEIHPNLFLGTDEDYEQLSPDWYVVQACKEPYHRRALGYTTHAAPYNHPEYLIARRGNRLILNLVDARSSRYIGKELIDEALKFIYLSLTHKVLVHCNEGRSRSPMIGLLYLAAFTDILPTTFDAAEEHFLKLYPPYNPGPGVFDFLITHFDHYRQNPR